jgi:FixJ family two-component response regulator
MAGGKRIRRRRHSVLGAVKRVLKAHGFDVEVFDTFQAFLGSARPSDASCLVLDIDLNGTSGIELKRQLTGAGVSVPVIFITGADKEANRQAALKAGCVAYLEKAVSFERPDRGD